MLWMRFYLFFFWFCVETTTQIATNSSCSSLVFQCGARWTGYDSHNLLLNHLLAELCPIGMDSVKLHLYFERFFVFCLDWFLSAEENMAPRCMNTRNNTNQIRIVMKKEIKKIFDGFPFSFFFVETKLKNWQQNIETSTYKSRNSNALNKSGTPHWNIQNQNEFANKCNDDVD